MIINGGVNVMLCRRGLVYKNFWKHRTELSELTRDVEFWNNFS